MYDLLTLGDVTIDLYFKGKDLTMKDGRFNLAIGGKYTPDQFYEGLGGDAANVSIGASTLGLNCAILAKLGENVFKQIVLQKLVNKRISTEFLLYERGFTNISSILLSPQGERTIIHYATHGSPLNLSELQRKYLTKAQALYMGNLPGIKLAEQIQLCKLFKTMGKPVFINLTLDDLGSRASLDMLLHLSDCLILNTHEYGEFIGKTREKIDFTKDQSSTLGMAGKILIITDAAGGSYGYFGGKVFHRKAAKVSQIIDSTGAGDGYTAGFIAIYMKTKDIERAMQEGSNYAAKILQKLGAN